MSKKVIDECPGRPSGIHDRQGKLGVCMICGGRIKQTGKV